MKNIAIAFATLITFASFAEAGQQHQRPFPVATGVGRAINRVVGFPVRVAVAAVTPIHRQQARVTPTAQIRVHSHQQLTARQQVTVQQPYVARQQVTVQQPIVARQRLVVHQQPYVARQQLTVQQPIVARQRLVVHQPYVTRQQVIFTQPQQVTLQPQQVTVQPQQVTVQPEQVQPQYVQPQQVTVQPQIQQEIQCPQAVTLTPSDPCNPVGQIRIGY